ncbi:EAL domain-containing protein [Aliivibrio sifiae]
MNKYRPRAVTGPRRFYSLFAFFIVIWGGSFGGAYVAIDENVNYQANNEIDRYGTLLIQQFDALLGSGEEALDDINKLAITDCSSDAVRRIGVFNFRYYLIQNTVLLMSDNHNTCSSMEGASEDALQATPAQLTYERVRYWFKQTRLSSIPSEHYMVIQKGNARINMHLRLLFDAYLINKPYLAVQFLSQSHVIAATKQMVGSSLLSTKEDWRSQLFVSLERKPFSVIVARSEYQIQQEVMTTFKAAFGWIALFALILCLFIYALIRKHQQSFRFIFIDGMKRGELKPYFQPIINIQHNVCVGAEVLTRWYDDNGHMISPAFFIPAAEQYGVMPILTLHIITQAFKQVGPFLSINSQYYISINLSLDDLENDTIYTALMQERMRYGLAPGQLRIELTERQFISKGCAISALHRYKDAGFLIYVDDFGTGYSSLRYLSELPIDTLKIDKGFIDSLGQHSATSSVTKHIIAMANTLNLNLIAEGVETKEQCHILHALGVYSVQGWLYSKALSGPDWILFCKRMEYK